MNIGLGKFDPALNPPPFSSWAKNFTAIEVDLFHYFLWKPKLKTQFAAWIKRDKLKIIPKVRIQLNRSRDEYSDAIESWNDVFAEQTAYLLIHSGRSEWSEILHSRELNKLPSSSKYYIEWGKLDSLRSVHFIARAHSMMGWVIDPDWHQASLAKLGEASLHFKLHGWNKERWVRRYGANRAAQLAGKIKSRKDSIITLSYSGKFEEASFFSG